MISLFLMTAAANLEAQGLEAARAGARVAGQFSPVNTALLTVAIGLLGMILNHQRQNRKMSIQVNGEVRQEFIDEMKALREEVKGLRRENDSLREEVRSLHGVIDGMRRESLAGHLSAQRVVAEALPTTPAMDRALRSLGNVERDAKA